MSQEGLFNKVDMLFIYSLAFHESVGCKNKEELKNAGFDTWKGGIMQVDACLKQDCSDEQIIQMGIEKFSNDYKKIEEFGAKDSKVIITLLLFSYNRGLGAAEKAFKYYDEKGLSLDDAMYKACEDYFNADALLEEGLTGVCDVNNKEKGDVEKCCAGAVTGKNYPNTILNKFYDFCEKAKGEVSEIPVFSYNNIGQYRITPNFQVYIDYDLTIYDELNTVVSEIYDECYDEECVQAKIDEWNEQEGQSFFLDIGYCGKKTNPSKKIFYDLAEEFNYAKNAQEENCYNAFTIDYIDYNVYNTIKPILPDPTEFITSEDIELYLSDKNTENYDFDIVENKVDLFVLKNGDELSLNLGMMPIYQGPCDITKNKIVMCASPVPESQNSVFYNNEPVNIGFSIQLKPEPVESVPEE
jgi:hypothetical protein